MLKVGYILFKVAMCPMTIKMPYGEEDLPDLKASFLMFVFVVDTCKLAYICSSLCCVSPTRSLMVRYDGGQ